MNALHHDDDCSFPTCDEDGAGEPRGRLASGTGVACSLPMANARPTSSKPAGASRELIHDLRSPLQAIGLHAALLRRELSRGQDAGLHHVETILREVRRIQALMERSPGR
jgi:hypothetical protein